MSTQNSERRRGWGLTGDTRLAWLSVVTSAVLVLVACDTGTAPSSGGGLQGEWQLAAFELDDGTVIRPTTGGEYAARFMEDGRLNVNADCNVCNGSYTATASTLTLGPLACTLAACPLGSLDNSFLAALGSARTWERNDTELLVRYDEGALRFVAE